MVTRRDFVLGGSAAVAGAALLGKDAAAAASKADPHAHERAHARAEAPGRPGRDYTPAVAPDVPTLPFQVRDGVKVFHLVAEPVKHAFAPGLEAECWGYNGSVPGPLIEVVEGDRVRFYVTNQLPEPTTVHWHGVILECGQDGVAGLTQPPIQVGETFRYDFTFPHAGTFMYHPHYDEMTQMALGMMGMIVVHPRRPTRKIDRDYCFMLSEWKLKPGTRRPDPNAMADFNVLTLNARAFPGTSPIWAKTGERVRLRFGNLSAMDHHPIHLHGYSFKVTGTDGGPIPERAQWPETTVLVPTGSTREVEFVADNPGDWAMHCHMTHHIMNQMGHDLPVLVGADVVGLDQKVRRSVKGYMTMGDKGMGGMGEMKMPVPKNSLPMKGGEGPFAYIDMGGMFTILKVRDEVGKDGKGSDWYEHPKGSVARVATKEELLADGIDAKGPSSKGPSSKGSRASKHDHGSSHG